MRLLQDTRAKLVELDKQSQELDEIIERASHLTAVNEEVRKQKVFIHPLSGGTLPLMNKIALP